MPLAQLQRGDTGAFVRLRVVSLARRRLVPSNDRAVAQAVASVFTGVNVDCSGLIGQIIGDDSDVVALAIWKFCVSLQLP